MRLRAFARDDFITELTTQDTRGLITGEPYVSRTPLSEGILIFCKDFDKSVENVRNKKPINARVVYATIEPMETEIHGGSEFWKFPAIGERVIKEKKARGYTLIGVLLMSDGVWLRVINDDFEFNVARQICEEGPGLNWGPNGVAFRDFEGVPTWGAKFSKRRHLIVYDSERNFYRCQEPSNCR